ncbi:MAG: glycosyltransferase family 9 protein [Deltaproteobacteria bacterium]|nr:glycosyltransferase family 9 protein [Deltaproteobacteria bacterium]
MDGAKILIIHQGAIGDFILSLPALQTIQNSFPGRLIEMLGYPAILSLAGSSFAATIRSADWAAASTLYGDFDDVTEQIRQYLAGFERLFFFSAGRSSAFTHNVQRCNPAAVHLRTFPDSAQHVVDFQLAQLPGLGLTPAGFVPQLRVSPADRSRADQYLLTHACAVSPYPLIAVHPGSGGRHKCWPTQSFVSVMHRLHEERHAGFLIVQGPADEKTAGNLKAGLAGLPCALLAHLDLPLVAAILSQSALFIGNDSGITHMAAALGIPTVAVFGPTDPAVWAPRGKSVSIVRSFDPVGQWLWPEPEQVLESARMLLAVDK